MTESLRTRTGKFVTGPQTAVAPYSLTSPIPGLLSIALAAIFAVWYVPDYVVPEDSLFLPAAILTAGLLTPVAVRIRWDMLSVLRVENALMLGIVYWILFDLLQCAYPMELVSQSHVQWAFASIGLFAFTLWLGASGRGWSLPRQVYNATKIPLTSEVLMSAILVSFTLGMLSFAIPSGFDPLVMYKGLVSDRWSAPWARGDLGGADAFVDHLQYFCYIIPALCVLLSRRLGWFHPQVVFAICLAALISLFLAQSGGRRIVGVTVGAGLFTWLICQRVLTPKVLFGSIVSVAALLIFMQAMLTYRHGGFQDYVNGDQVENKYSAHFHVDDNFLRLSQIIMIFPDRHDYVYHGPLYHALCLPIPRLFWAGKPLNPGFSLPELIGRVGASLSSSIIGELYASLGIIAVALGGFVMGRLAGMWNKCLQLNTGEGRALMHSLGLMALFAGLRSVQALVQMSYIVLAWIAIAAIVNKIQASRAQMVRR